MTSTTLAAHIGSLTHICDAMERAYAALLCVPADHSNVCYDLLLGIASLHDTIDSLNLDYEEALDRERDHAFEAVGR